MTEPQIPTITLDDLDAIIARIDANMDPMDLDGKDLSGFVVLHPKAFRALKRWGFLPWRCAPIARSASVRGRKRALMANFRPTPQQVKMMGVSR